MSFINQPGSPIAASLNRCLQEFHSVSEPDTEFDFSVDGIEYTGDLATDIKRPTIYFAIGMRKDDSNWISPTEKQLQQIGIEGVQAASAAKGGYIHYVNDIRWVDWNTVIIDHGKPEEGYGGGNDDVKLKYENNRWRIVEDGRFWVS